MAAIPHSNYFRHRLYPRLRHGKKLKAFLAAEATALASTATGTTMVPVRTTNTKAEALAVFASQPAALDTFTISPITYTFVAALTEVFAAGTLTNDATNVTDLDTVTIAGKVYTFQSSLTNVDGNVKIGASAAASMTNLFHAINATGGTVGTDYATLTTAHPTVVATNPTGTTVVVTAKTSGVAGNLLATVEASTHLVWGAATLVGGVDGVANQVLRGADATASRDNLVLAITAGANAGVKYSSATVVHPFVTAAAATNDMLITALLATTFGVRVLIASSAAHITLALSHLDGPGWTAAAHGISDAEGPYLLTNSGGALPTGSLTSELWVHVIDANTVALATSIGALRRGDFMQTTSAGTGTHTLTKAVGSQGIFDALRRNKTRTVVAATDIDNLK